MIAILTRLAARMGVPARLQRAVAWVLVAVALTGAAMAAVSWWRDMVRQERAEAVKADRNAANYEVVTSLGNASIAADQALQNTQAVDRQNEKELQREIDAAAPSNGAVGPVTGGLLERLRQQQAAGRR